MKQNEIGSPPIRVLEVFGRMNRGGAEAMIMNLYRKIDRNRVQLDFMVHTDEHCQFDDEIRQLGGRIFRVPRFRVTNYFSYRRAWHRYFQTHPEVRVVHGHMGATAAIYLHEANSTGRFTIAHSHSADYGLKSITDFGYKFFSYPTRFVAQQFFGCSTKAGIARYGQRIVDSANYRNFPNAIDLDQFTYSSSVRDEMRKKLGVLDSQLVIIHVGRIAPPKNPGMILKIFQEIVRQHANAICLWVGTGELESEYRQMIERGGLQGRIRMMGVRSDISALLMAADSFLFPSLWEGLPVSVIEAQATGIPCVISDTITHEVEVTPLIEWHSLSESPTLWAERCLLLAVENRKQRKSPISSLRLAGYDIEESVRWLTDFYISKASRI